MKAHLKNRVKISVGFFLLLLIFFHKIIFTGQSFFVRDTLIQFHPWRVFAAEQIKDGKIPLWNPYTYSGMPFLANMQSAVFYPPNILFYVLPFAAAYKFYILFHFFLAGFLMYLLMRDFGVSENAAFVSGVVFAFNGYLLARIEFLSVLGTSVWLPAAFLLLRKCLEKNSRFKSVIFLGTVFAVQFLAGHPQVLLYGIFLLLFYAVCNDVKYRKIKALSRLAVAGLIAVLISAVQLIPVLEFLLHSTRAGGLDYGIVTTNSLPLRGLFNFFNPFPEYHHNFWASACYIGIIPVLLSAAALFPGRHPPATLIRKKNVRKIALFFGAVFLISIFFAAGKFNPLFKFFYGSVPLFGSIRYPAAILYLSVFSAAVLAGFGLDRLRFLPRSCAQGRGSRTARTIIAVLVICDLFIAGRRFNSITDRKIFTVYGNKIAFLRANNGFHRFFLTPKTDSARMVRGLSFFGAWSNWKDNLYGNTNMCFRLFNAGGQDLRIKRCDDFLNRVAASGSIARAEKLLSMLNVKYVLSMDGVKSQKYKEVLGGPVKIYENGNFLPRAFFVRKAVIKEKAEVLDYLAGGLFNPLKEVVLEKAPEERTEKQALSGNEKGSAEIVHYNAGEVVVRVFAPGDGWVVLSDAYFPGWKAYIDGEKTEIFRANYIFRAVSVGPGRHTIKFVYKPVSYKIGEAATVVSLLCVLAVVLIK
ncbi:MAG: YfhO family protein [bacterium]